MNDDSPQQPDYVTAEIVGPESGNGPFAPPPPVAPRGFPIWGVILGLSAVGLALLIGAVGVALFVTGPRWAAVEPLPPRELETAEVKFQKVAEAFESTPGNEDVSDEPRLAPLHKLMGRLQVAFASGDPEVIAQEFDAERMLREVLRVAELPMSEREFHDMLPQYARDAGLALARESRVFAFERYEIRRADFNEAGDEVTIYTRQWNLDGIAGKHRWWCCRRDGAWRMYDFEELETSIRNSSVSSVTLLWALKDPAKLDRLQPEILKLSEAKHAALAGDPQSAEQALAKMTPGLLPTPYEALRHLIAANIEMSREDWPAALAELERAEVLHEDMLILGLMRAMIYNHQERFEEARIEAERYIKTLGGDADASAALMIALEGLGQPEAAIEAARAGLEDDPSSGGLLFLLAERLPEGERDEIATRFKRLPQPEQWLDAFAEKFLSDPGTLEALLAAYEAEHPDKPAIAYWRARGLLEQREPEAALQLVQPWIADNPDRNTLWFLWEVYYEAALQSGKWTQLYNDTEDQVAWFAPFANFLLTKGDMDTLARLVNRHAERAPDDPQLLHMQAQLAAHRQDWPAAVTAHEQIYERLADMPEDDPVRMSARYDLVWAMHQAGQGPQALEEVAPQGDTFRQLMNLADETQGRLLLEKYAAEQPEDAAVIYWTAVRARQDGDFDTALRLLDEHNEQLLADEWIGDSVGYERLINLVELGRHDEAEAFAKSQQAKYPQPILLAMAAAGRGDVAETERRLNECMELGYYYFSGDFYDVEILGDQLRTEPFATLREKFPPPEEAEAPEATVPM